MTESSSAQAMPKPGLRELADLCAERNFCAETAEFLLSVTLQI